MHPLPPPRCVRIPAALLLVLAATGCGGSAATGGGAVPAGVEEWQALREPRPEPLPGATRLTVSPVVLAGSFPWPDAVRVGPDIGLSELVATNLLRRRDVRFVERRRFDAAATAERQGQPGPPNRPPAGVSTSAELELVVTWLPTTPGDANLEIRLTRLETGDVDGTTRMVIPRDAPPVSVARSIVVGTLELLDELGRLPEWDASEAEANVGAGERVSTEALRHFLRGLAFEETWSWEGARRGYQQALAADPRFHEARSALARTARLRLGGTLAES